MAEGCRPHRTGPAECSPLWSKRPPTCWLPAPSHSAGPRSCPAENVPTSRWPAPRQKSHRGSPRDSPTPRPAPAQSSESRRPSPCVSHAPVPRARLRPPRDGSHRAGRPCASNPGNPSREWNRLSR